MRMSDAAEKYLKTFSPEERLAGRAGKEVLCKICKQVIGWTDVLNYYEYIEILCPECKSTYDSRFLAKREQFT